MNNKWFKCAAVKGSGYEALADSAITVEEISNEKMSDIDLLFVENLSEFFSKKRGGFFTIVTDKPVALEDQEKFILEHPGNFFYSRIGHDIINLISPLEHYEYIDHELIVNRVQYGNHFGKQINFVGHLLQNTATLSTEHLTYPELIENIQTLCRKLGIKFSVEEKAKFTLTLKHKFLILKAVEEIILNWKEHGKEEFVLSVFENTLTFSNKLRKPLTIDRPKAQLRCPFMQKNTGKGHGLGLYIVSVASSKGDFDWNIFTDENYFSLSLLFS